MKTSTAATLPGAISPVIDVAQPSLVAEAVIKTYGMSPVSESHVRVYSNSVVSYTQSLSNGVAVDPTLRSGSLNPLPSGDISNLLSAIAGLPIHPVMGNYNGFLTGIGLSVQYFVYPTVTSTTGVEIYDDNGSPASFGDGVYRTLSNDPAHHTAAIVNILKNSMTMLPN